MAQYTLSPGPVSPPLEVSWYDTMGTLRRHTLQGGETIVIDANDLTPMTRRLIERRFLFDVTGTYRELPTTEGTYVGGNAPSEGAWRQPVQTEAALPLVGDPLNVFRVVLASGQLYRHVADSGTVQQQWRVISQGGPQPVTMTFPGEAWVDGIVGSYKAPTACQVTRVQLSALDDEPHGDLTVDLVVNNVALEAPATLPDTSPFEETTYGTPPQLNAGDLLQVRITAAARGNLSAVVIFEPVYS